MKLAVLIPDRNDRPQFLANCLRMMRAQTLQPDHIEVVNDTPKDDRCDITYRYRIGYDRLRGKGFDIIALIENDDWYSPDYLRTMAGKWEAFEKPDLLGTAYTIYYHLKLRGYFRMEHFRRASAMNTLIKPDLNFDWCPDFEPYTDIHLWKLAQPYSTDAPLSGIVFKPDQLLSIGMKHGEGMCGGRNHRDRFGRYREKDADFAFLSEHLDQGSFDFYTNLYKNETPAVLAGVHS